MYVNMREILFCIFAVQPKNSQNIDGGKHEKPSNAMDGNSQKAIFPPVICLLMLKRVIQQIYVDRSFSQSTFLGFIFRKKWKSFFLEFFFYNSKGEEFVLLIHEIRYTEEIKVVERLIWFLDNPLMTQILFNSYFVLGH